MKTMIKLTALTFLLLFALMAQTHATAVESPVSETPAAPAELRVKIIDNSTVKLYWSDKSTNELGFIVERKVAGGNFTEVATLPADHAYYVDSGLSSELYYYRVKAFNNTGSSGHTNIVEITLTVGEVPSPPAELAVIGVSGNVVKLTWADKSNNEAGFKIERKKADGNYETVAIASANSTSYTDKGLAFDTSYSYRIRAYNDAGKSGYSNEANAKTGTAPADGIPIAPSKLTLKQLDGNSIKIYWVDNSSNEAGFLIERKGSDGKYQQIASVPANTVYYVDENFKNDQTYYYRVRAYNNAGKSDYSNSVASGAVEQVPAAPAKLSVKVASGSSLKLSWADTSNNETGFKIERKTAGSKYEQIAVVEANRTTYTDKNLSAGTSYYYRVRAYNTSGKSTYSNEAKGVIVVKEPEKPAPEKELPDEEETEPKEELPVTDVPKPVTEKIFIPAPTGLTAVTDPGGTDILLSWNAEAGAEIGYDIERKTGDGEFSVLATVAGHLTTYTDTGLEEDTQYSYRIRALHSSAVSEYSEVAGAITERKNISIVNRLVTSLKQLGSWFVSIFSFNR